MVWTWISPVRQQVFLIYTSLLCNIVDLYTIINPMIQTKLILRSPGMLWANPKETTGFLRMLCDLGTHDKPSFKTSLPQNSSKILASNPWMVTRPWHKVAMWLGAHIVTSLVPQPQLWQAVVICRHAASGNQIQQQARKDCGFQDPVIFNSMITPSVLVSLSRCIEHTMICQGARPSEVGTSMLNQNQAAKHKPPRGRTRMKKQSNEPTNKNHQKSKQTTSSPFVAPSRDTPLSAAEPLSASILWSTLGSATNPATTFINPSNES